MIRSMVRQFKNNKGFALPTVTLFIFIIGISGVTLFSVAANETRQARYRQNSSEAFLLADGAIERTKAKFLEDRSWRDGWDEIEYGEGIYSVSVVDTVFDGNNHAVQVVSMGQSENARRGVEVMALVPPAAFWYGLFIYGDAKVLGNLCIDGVVYVGGDADLGHNDVHLACGGIADYGFDITPPKVYTEAAYYPEATYYDVRATESGGTVCAKIFDRYGNDLSSALGDSLQNIISYNNGTKEYDIDFDSHAIIEQYFNESTGFFSRDAGDVAVVVNFGGIPLVDPPGVQGVCNVYFDGSAASNVHATTLNSRFFGVSDDQRTDRAYWTGGVTTVKQIVFEPYYGIAMITHVFQEKGNGGSNAFIGTSNYPALLYVTEEVDRVGANFYCEGEIICLGEWSNQAGPDLKFNPDFMDYLPDYFFGAWHEGVSGAMQVLRWKEFSGNL